MQKKIYNYIENISKGTKQLEWIDFPKKKIILI